jgi:hypothetical protein
MKEPLSVRRNVEGIGKRIDVSKPLISARAGVGHSVLQRAGLLGELVPVELRIEDQEGGQRYQNGEQSQPATFTKEMAAEAVHPENPVRWHSCP